VPYFIDGKTGLALNESSAILVFLAQKYDKAKKYFPSDIELQAKINQRLHFDATVLWPAFKDIIVS
jgi:glutathione S-transferase